MIGDPLELPLPRELAETFGYRGDARYVGFCWSPLGDELTYSDGVASGSAQSWAWLSFKRHPAVHDHLADFDLGSSEEDAAHALIVDRAENRASVAPVSEARAFLADQHPPQEPMTPEEIEAVRAEFEKLLKERNSRPFDHEAFERQVREQRNRMAAMLAFLDQHIPPGQGQTP